MRVARKDEAAGAEAVVLLPPEVTGWGQPLLDALAAAAELPSVGEVWVRFDGHEPEGPLPAGMPVLSWRAINAPDATVLVREGAGSGLPPGATADAVASPGITGVDSAAHSSVETQPVPAQRAAAPLQLGAAAPPFDAASQPRIGLKLPKPSEEVRNWKRVHALFLDEPHPVPRVLQQVFIECFNAKYGPDFTWDDSARVPPAWRWGDPDPDPADASSDWVSKYALLLYHGSRSFKPTPLPYKVTHEKCRLAVVESAAEEKPPRDFKTGDWVGIDDGSGTIREGTVTGVPPEGKPKKGPLPAGTFAVSDELENHSEQVSGCPAFRATVRPPPTHWHRGDDAKAKLLARGVSALDTTVLFHLLMTNGQRGFRDVIESRLGGAEAVRQLEEVKSARNEVAGHLIGGVVPTPGFDHVKATVLKLINVCKVAGLVSAEHAALLTKSVHIIAEHDMEDRYDLLELMPGASVADSVRKGHARMRRLTAAQSSLFVNKILRSVEPRLLVQSPPGSGKTVLCQHLALNFLAGRLDTPTPEVRRFLLVTHSAALANECASYIETVARDSLGVPLDRVETEGPGVERSGNGCGGIGGVDGDADASDDVELNAVRALGRWLAKQPNGEVSAQKFHHLFLNDSKVPADVKEVIRRHKPKQISSRFPDHVVFVYSTQILRAGIASAPAVVRNPAVVDRRAAIVLRLVEPPTEIHVVSVDALVSSLTGASKPVDALPLKATWQQDMLELFHQVAVDEGHLVFAHQPRLHLDGQHLLRNCDDVSRVVEAVAMPGCRMTIFHDKDYQGSGVQVSRLPGCEDMAAGLAMVRCPASVRDASVVYAQSLCNEEAGGEVAHFVPLQDERHKGPDVVLVNVEKPLMWRDGRGLSARKSNLANKVLAAADSTGSGVLTFATVLSDRERADAGGTRHVGAEASSLYARTLVRAMASVAQQYINADGSILGWGDVAVLLPGDSDTLAGELFGACSDAAPDEIRDVLATATFDAQDRNHMYFGPAENMAGLERVVVMVTGFWHPTALLKHPPTTVSARDGGAGKLLSRVDYRVYLAVTRCTQQLYIVEPDVESFASHFRIRDVVATGGDADLVGKPVGGGAKSVAVEGASADAGRGTLRPTSFSSLDEHAGLAGTVSKKHRTGLKHVSDELRNDPDFVVGVVQQDGMALRYASAKVKSNRDVVLAAVRQNGMALKDAPAKLKKNRDVVLAAVQQNGNALRHASDELKNNRDVVLAAVRQNGNALRHASAGLKSDPAVAIAARARKSGAAS